MKNNIDCFIRQLYSGRVCRDRLYLRHALCLMAERPELRVEDVSTFCVTLAEEMAGHGWCITAKTIRPALSFALRNLRTAHPEWNVPGGTVAAVAALLDLCGV